MEQHFEMFETYLTDKRKYSINTIESYMNDLKRFAEFAVSEGLSNEPQKFNKTNIYAYIMHMEKTGVSVHTIIRRISSLKGFYYFLFTRGIVKSNPVDDIEVPKSGKKPPEILSVEDVDRLLNSINESKTAGAKCTRDRAMIELLYAAGLRVSELIGLRLCDVNLNYKYVKCVGRGERVIPIGQKAINALDEYINNTRNILGGDNTDILFLNISGKPMSRQGFWKIIKHYAEEAGISTSISPQTLRHSFAVHMLANGAPVQSVKEMLGHSEVSATMVYVKYGGEKANPGLGDVYKSSHPRYS